MKYIERLIPLFEANRNEANSEPMKKYMKNHFPFLGIKTPARRELMKQFYKETSILKEPFQTNFVLALWKKEEREYQYAALDYIGRVLKKLDKGDLPLMEQLITTKSWWDTVDTIAPHPVGTIAQNFPEVITETIEGWAYGDHMWLQRASILFQLRFKENTDEELLFKYIKQNSESKEFFIQKAIAGRYENTPKQIPNRSNHSLKGILYQSSVFVKAVSTFNFIQ